MDKNKTALLIGVGSFLTWGMLAIYWTQLKSVDPIEIVAHRAVWSVVFAGILTVCLRQGLQVIKAFKTSKLLLALICSSCLIALNWGIYIWAVINGRIVETSMGYYINPLFNVAASALIFRVALNKYQAVAIGFACIGVAIIIIGYGKVPYVAITLAASFCIYGVIRKVVPIDAMAGLFVETVIIACPALIYILYKTVDGTGALVTADNFTLFLLVLGGIVTTLPLAGFAYAAKILNLSTVGIMQYISPTVSFLIGVFMYNEVFTNTHLMSFIFIWIGLVIYTADSIIKYEKEKKSVKN